MSDNAKMPTVGVPSGYTAQNYINSLFNPSFYHVGNTYLQQYFKRYLFNKLVSVFDFKIPKNWDIDYLRNVLFSAGFIGVFDSKEYGVIPQFGNISGYDLYYRPKRFTCSNPNLKNIYYNLEIGKECVIVKLTDDYMGLMDLVNYYADQLALCAETWGVNLFTARVGYVGITGSKAGAETLKKAYDEMSGGNPFIVLDKEVMRDDGSKPWEWFAQNLKQNYLGSDILADMRKIEVMFDSDIGLKNANEDKKERMIVDEVNANNESTLARSDVWLDNLKEGFKEVKELFNIDVTVERRYNETESATVNHDDLPSLPVGI